MLPHKSASDGHIGAWNSPCGIKGGAYLGFHGFSGCVLGVHKAPCRDSGCIFIVPSTGSKDAAPSSNMTIPNDIPKGGWGALRDDLSAGDQFGASIAVLHAASPLLPPGVVVGAPGAQGGRGSIFVLEMTADFRRKGHFRIEPMPGFSGPTGRGLAGPTFDSGPRPFGASVASIHGLGDAGRTNDIAVGEPGASQVHVLRYDEWAGEWRVTHTLPVSSLHEVGGSSGGEGTKTTTSSEGSKQGQLEGFGTALTQLTIPAADSGAPSDGTVTIGIYSPVRASVSVVEVGPVSERTVPSVAIRS